MCPTLLGDYLLDFQVLFPTYSRLWVFLTLCILLCFPSLRTRQVRSREFRLLEVQVPHFVQHIWALKDFGFLPREIHLIFPVISELVQDL